MSGFNCLIFIEPSAPQDNSVPSFVSSNCPGPEPKLDRNIDPLTCSLPKECTKSCTPRFQT